MSKFFTNSFVVYQGKKARVAYVVQTPCGTRSDQVWLRFDDDSQIGPINAAFVDPYNIAEVIEEEIDVSLNEEEISSSPNEEIPSLNEEEIPSSPNELISSPNEETKIARDRKRNRNDKEEDEDEEDKGYIVSEPPEKKQKCDAELFDDLEKLFEELKSMMKNKIFSMKEEIQRLKEYDLIDLDGLNLDELRKLELKMIENANIICERMSHFNEVKRED